MLKVLSNKPYHLHWMIIQKRRELIISNTLPSQILFWIRLNYCFTTARIRVFIDGLKSFIIEIIIEFSSGEERLATLEDLTRLIIPRMGLSDICGLKSLSIATPMDLILSEQDSILRNKISPAPIILGVHSQFENQETTLPTHRDETTTCIIAAATLDSQSVTGSLHTMAPYTSTIPLPKKMGCPAKQKKHGSSPVTSQEKILTNRSSPELNLLRERTHLIHYQIDEAMYVKVVDGLHILALNPSVLTAYRDEEDSGRKEVDSFA
ncbi:hypothetical protein Bca4012_076555 [Brassica carinata]